MKKRLLNTLIILLATIHCCFGQVKVQKYCEVFIPAPVVLGGARKVNVDLGGLGSPDFKDSTEKNKVLAVARLSNAVDVLNYMSKMRWTLVSISVTNSRSKLLYFKKEFDAAELTDVNESK